MSEHDVEMPMLERKHTVEMDYFQMNGTDDRLYENGWTKKTLKHLFTLRKDYLESSIYHHSTRDKFVALKKALHIPSIVFLSCTTFLLAISQTITDPKLMRVVYYLNLLTSLFATVFQGLISLFNPTERAENHNRAGNNYIDLARYIEEYLILDPSKCPDVLVILEAVRLKAGFYNQMANYVPMKFIKKHDKD